MKLSRKKKTVITLLLIFTITGVSSFEVKEVNSPEPFFTLIAKYYEHEIIFHDVLQLIKQQLASIHINLDIIPFSGIPSLSELIAFSDFDLFLLPIVPSFNYGFDLFGDNVYNENGSYNFSAYHTSMDWDEDLGTGKNEWFIQSGLQMTPNNSLEQISHSWEWQNYLMDEILPCLPISTLTVNNISQYNYLIFNMRESRPILGSRNPCPRYPYASQGLALRKAISYAINREEIKRVVLGDEYVIYNHPINPTNSSWLNPNPVKYCYDLTAARDFMTTVGYDTCWAPETYIGYGVWPNWEDVCSKNMTTIRNPGFDIGVTCLSLIILIAFGFCKKRRWSRNYGD